MMTDVEQFHVSVERDEKGVMIWKGAICPICGAVVRGLVGEDLEMLAEDFGTHVEEMHADEEVGIGWAIPEEE